MRKRGSKLTAQQKANISAGLKRSTKVRRGSRNHPFKKKFQEQKDRAIQRKIGWELSFEQWLQIWVDSGHLHERGCHRGQYVMARFGDKGPYAAGNVKICTVEENRLEIKISEKGRVALIASLIGNTRGYVNKGRPFSEEHKANLKIGCRLREERKRQARLGCQ